MALLQFQLRPGLVVSVAPNVSVHAHSTASHTHLL